MSKKLFKSLIRKASTPVPKEQDTQRYPLGYTEKQTHPRKAADTLKKRGGKSRQSNASSGSKSPQ